MHIRWKPFWNIIKATGKEWSAAKVPRLGAALAFYSVLSLGPLLLIIVSAAGLVFDRQAISARIVAQMSNLVGNEGAGAIRLVLENSQKHSDKGIIAMVAGIVTLILGATGVFGQLQDALNTIWKVQAKPGAGLWWSIRRRFLSFAAVLGTGFLLLVSLIISSALSAVGDYFTSSGSSVLLGILNAIGSFAIATFLFALIFKLLPDVKIRWHDVWIGAAITAVLFTVGKAAIGLYLGHSAISSVYGASGSLIVLLLWVYYSSQILFIGAEFTQVYAQRYGSRIVPARDAVPLTPQACAQQGMESDKKDKSATG